MVNLLEAYIPSTWLNNEIKLISIDNTIKIPFMVVLCLLKQATSQYITIITHQL